MGKSRQSGVRLNRSSRARSGERCSCSPSCQSTIRSPLSPAHTTRCADAFDPLSAENSNSSEPTGQYEFLHNAAGLNSSCHSFLRPFGLQSDPERAGDDPSLSPIPPAMARLTITFFGSLQSYCIVLIALLELSSIRRRGCAILVRPGQQPSIGITTHP